LQAMPSPPPPRPLPIAPEVWDACAELHGLGVDCFALFQWPFKQPPTSQVITAPPERSLVKDVPLDPLVHGDYAVQCRAPSTHGWITCESRFLLVHGKPLCLVPSLPPLGPHVDLPVRLPWYEEDLPRPVNTTRPAVGHVGDDEIEFRIARSGDCEVSAGLPIAVTPPRCPWDVKVGLKMLPPHSTLVMCIRFHGLCAVGCASTPRQYQVQVEEVGGDTQLLPPVQLPLERIPEAFSGTRSDVAFLGEAVDPSDRGELGPNFLGARGGGEVLSVLDPLEFEHLLSFRELSYGRRYKISVRWLSSWRACTCGVWECVISHTWRTTPSSHQLLQTGRC